MIDALLIRTDQPAVRTADLPFDSHAMTRLAIATLTVTLALTAIPVAAQTRPASSARGFFVGAHLNSSSVKIDEFHEEAQSGGGLGLQVGYGFTRQVGLFLDLTGAALDERIGLGHVDLGVRYAFTGPTRRWVPTLELALTARALTEEDGATPEGGTGDITFSGGGLTFGAGIQYYTAPKWAIGASIKWTGGEFDDYTVDDVTVGNLGYEATSTRINLGITWFPMGGR